MAIREEGNERSVVSGNRVNNVFLGDRELLLDEVKQGWKTDCPKMKYCPIW